MRDCVPPFFMAIAPWLICMPLEEPPPTPNDVVICAAAGRPTVTVPLLSPTSTSLEVPLKVSVPPRAMADVLLPSDTVMLLLESALFAMFDSVLFDALIVLFVSVWVAESPTRFDVVVGSVSVTFPENALWAGACTRA